MRAQKLRDLGIARLRVDIVDDERLLGLPDQAGGRFLDGGLEKVWFDRGSGCEHPEAHGVALGDVQYEVQILEADHAVQALGEVLEEAWEVAVERNRLRNLEQGAVLIDGGISIVKQVQI